jgi:hypothetical protein
MTVVRGASRAETKEVEFGEKFLTDEAGWTCVREARSRSLLAPLPRS